MGETESSDANQCYRRGSPRINASPKIIASVITHNTRATYAFQHTVHGLLNLNSVNQLIFVMVKCGVLFKVRTEFLNTMKTSFGIKGLKIFPASFSY
jgi:hypothetical protein